MSPLSSIIKPLAMIVAVLALFSCLLSSTLEAKLMRRQRIYDESLDGPSGYGGPYSGGATGERAIMTVRGARGGPSGMPPSKLQIEDSSYGGSYPHSAHNRLNSGYGGRGRMPYSDYGYSNYGGIGSMNGAPTRMAVTGVFPY